MSHTLETQKLYFFLVDAQIILQPFFKSSKHLKVATNSSQTLMAGNFAALWPADSKFSALKDLNPFKIVLKVQEASSI